MSRRQHQRAAAAQNRRAKARRFELSAPVDAEIDGIVVGVRGGTLLVRELATKRLCALRVETCA
jgi:hypothetical protein